MTTSNELEKQAALQIAALMAAAARTAPKTRGVDNIQVLAIDDEPTKKKLIAKMREIAVQLKFFDSNVRQALGIPLSVTGKSPFFDRKP